MCVVEVGLSVSKMLLYVLNNLLLKITLMIIMKRHLLATETPLNNEAVPSLLPNGEGCLSVCNVSKLH